MVERTNLVNHVDVRLAAPVFPPDLFIEVDSAVPLPVVPYYLTINPFDGNNLEIVKVTAVAVNILTVERDLDGTGHTTHPANMKVRVSYTKQNQDDIWDVMDLLGTSIRWRDASRAATLVETTLFGEQTIDGVALVDGDKVTVRAQTDPVENGFYLVVDGGPWIVTDTPWFDGYANVIAEGTIQSGRGYMLEGENSPVNIGVDEVEFLFMGNFGGQLDSAYLRLDGTNEMSEELNVVRVDAGEFIHLDREGFRMVLQAPSVADPEIWQLVFGSAPEDLQELQFVDEGVVTPFMRIGTEIGVVTETEFDGDQYQGYQRLTDNSLRILSPVANRVRFQFDGTPVMQQVEYASGILDPFFTIDRTQGLTIRSDNAAQTNSLLTFQSGPLLAPLSHWDITMRGDGVLAGDLDWRMLTAGRRGEMKFFAGISLRRWDANTDMLEFNDPVNEWHFTMNNAGSLLVRTDPADDPDRLQIMQFDTNVGTTKAQPQHLFQGDDILLNNEFTTRNYVHNYNVWTMPRVLPNAVGDWIEVARWARSSNNQSYRRFRVVVEHPSNLLAGSQSFEIGVHQGLNLTDSTWGVGIYDHNRFSGVFDSVRLNDSGNGATATISLQLRLLQTGNWTNVRIYEVPNPRLTALDIQFTGNVNQANGANIIRRALFFNSLWTGFSRGSTNPDSALGFDWNMNRVAT